MPDVADWSVTNEIQERYRHMTGEPAEHDVRPYFAVLAPIDACAAGTLSDAALRDTAAGLRQRALQEPLEAVLPQVFAVVREVADRVLGLRPFAVQMAAGVALARGRLAQLATGEGKTLAAVAPAVLHALAGRGVHIFTANDYLARRDAGWMGPLYRAFGLECASVAEGMTPDARRRAYAADVTYVTAREAGFDYLRDHAATSRAALVHRGHHVAIVDEADCILIDEARVPLVIAGPAPAPGFDPVRLAAVARSLRRGVDYTADEYGRTVIMTEAGFAHAGALLGVALDAPDQHLLLSAVHVSLHAETLLRRDRDYVVRDDRVEIVDEWTGRVADNRRWPNGIQPAVEAKEGVPVRQEGRILGSVPMQHFVRLYAHLAGMTATAEPAAEEFAAFFGLGTVVFRPNRECRRVDEPDVIFSHRALKEAAILDEVARVHPTGRPILVGTTSVAESEELGRGLVRRGIPCVVLNARQDAHEAAIIAGAGRLGAVTISTNMAGRGTDIVLGGGDPDEHQAVVEAGGLYVLGTNRHESRRVDDQLRGRAGRQGDPGASRFFISLEDDLIQRYGVMALIPAKHHPATAGLVHDPVVAREIARAQRIVEGQNFEIRRTLWRYSAVVEQQRRIISDWRQSLLPPLRVALPADGGSPARLAAAPAEAAPAGMCEAARREQFDRLSAAVGPDAVRQADAAIVRHVLDDRWSDHLAFIEDVREGIHLQRYAGREPVTEFHRQIVDGFEGLIEDVEAEACRRFERLQVVDGSLDLSGAGLAGSSSTWTYLVNDNPFSTFGLSLMASRNIGLAGGAGVLAVVYWPVTTIAAITVLVRRWLKRRRA